MMSSENPQILHFCVNYNCQDDILRLAKFWQSNPEYIQNLVQPIVIDNSPKDADSWATQLPEKILYSTPGDNLGYIGAPRWAFSQFKTKPWKWLIISNADMEFSSDFYTRLLEREEDGVGMVAPQIIGEISGTDQNPYLINRPSRLQMKFWVFIKSIVPLAQLYHGIGMLKLALQRGKQPSPSIAPKTIYAPHGSVFIFHRSYFVKGGDLNHPGFMSGEEIYFAERTRELGLKVYYRPQMQVHHREHGVTGRWPRPIMIRYAHHSMRNILNNHFLEKSPRDC